MLGNHVPHEVAERVVVLGHSRERHGCQSGGNIVGYARGLSASDSLTCLLGLLLGKRDRDLGYFGHTMIVPPGAAEGHRNYLPQGSASVVWGKGIHLYSSDHPNRTGHPFSESARLAIRLVQRLERPYRRNTQGVERTLDHLGYPEKGKASGEERVNCDLVGSVEHARSGTTRAHGLASQTHTRKR